MLTLGGLTSPDTFGPEHGNYLPQRIVLCGLVALAVVVDIDPRRWSGRHRRRRAGRRPSCSNRRSSGIMPCYSDRTAGEIVRARDAVGRGRRVAFLPASVRSRFRANPLLHVDNWLGVGTDNIVWGNYETRHYYFPVQFRPGIDRPPPDELEDIVAARRARRCRRPRPRLGAAPRPPRRRDRRARDLQGAIPCSTAVSERFFREVERRGDVRILGAIEPPTWPARRTDRSNAGSTGIAGSRASPMGCTRGRGRW